MLEFQTASSEAILLYLQGSVHADFVALQLTGGILVFSFNLGSGRVDIESEGTYNDGEIHTVRPFSFCSNYDIYLMCRLSYVVLSSMES